MDERTSRGRWWLLIIIILGLLAGNVYWILHNQWAATTAPVVSEVVVPLNNKIVSFLKLFIDKVLKADKEIDFETRLQLENGVRNLEDKEVLAAWQKFTASKTEQEAQQEVNNLLTLLVNKLQVR